MLRTIQAAVGLGRGELDNSRRHVSGIGNVGLMTVIKLDVNFNILHDLPIKYYGIFFYSVYISL